MILSDSKPILFVILLLVDVERLRDAMPTDGAHCGVHSSIHLLQLSFTERLHLLLLFLLFHILNDLIILAPNIVIYFTKAISYKLKNFWLTLKLLATNSIPSLHRKQGIQIQRKELLDTQSTGANHQSTMRMKGGREFG